MSVERQGADEARAAGAEAISASATDEQRLKLTSYFGERDRSGGHLLADALLNLYGEQKIQSSILLRGAQGFGLEHHLRTDRLLTLSEDLTVVAIALDAPARIERLLGPVVEIQRRGLLTLERAKLGPSRRGSTEDYNQEAAAKLTVYLGRHERVAGAPAFAAVCALLHREGVAGASVFLGVDGTRNGQRRRARFFARNVDVPMMILAVGTSEQIARVAPKLYDLLQEPLLTLERVRICKRDGQLIDTPHELPGTDEHGLPLWQKLTLIHSEAALHGGRAMHLELIQRLRQAGAAGATSLRGIWGFHGDHAPHGDRLLSLRRHVPMLTTVVDAPDRIAALFPLIDSLTQEHGLLTSEIVPAMSAYPGSGQRGGLCLAGPGAR